jgi:hypothetical protein
MCAVLQREKYFILQQAKLRGRRRPGPSRVDFGQKGNFFLPRLLNMELMALELSSKFRHSEEEWACSRTGTGHLNCQRHLAHSHLRQLDAKPLIRLPLRQCKTVKLHYRPALL